MKLFSMASFQALCVRDLIARPYLFTASKAIALAVVFGAILPAVGFADDCDVWTERKPANPPPPGQDIQMTFDSSRNRTVAIIGYADNEQQVSVREYDSFNWYRVFPAVSPATRTGGAFVYHEGSRKSWLFGGMVNFGPGNNELWSWDGSRWEQQPVSGLWPPASSRVRGAYDPARDRIIFILSTLTGVWETWEWGGPGNGWDQGPNLGPIGSTATEITFDSWRNRAVVYTSGAQDNWEQHWEYTPGTTAAQGSWQRITIDDSPYDSKNGSSLVFDSYRGKVLRFFGKSSLSLFGYNAEGYVWDHGRKRWILDFNRSLPWNTHGRAGAGAAFDTRRGVVVVQGGLDYRFEDGTAFFVNYQDTWELANHRPGIMNHPTVWNTGCLGGSAVFAAAVFDGPYTLQWFHNDQPISGANGLLLVRENLSHADAGSYVLGVANECGTTHTMPAWLEILDPVTIAAPPNYTRSACPGRSPIMLGPTVSGTYPIEMRLQRNDGEVWTDVPGQTGPPGSLFQVLNARNSDTGLYRFAISNYCGVVHTEPGHLQVGVTFSAHPQDASANPCESVAFSIEAQGTSQLGYQWQRDGIDLIDGDRVAGATTARLTISGLRYEDEGNYRCIVTDACESRPSRYAALMLPTPQWVQQASGPLYRLTYSSDMAYDPVRGVSVMFGGYTNSGYSDETWEWDGIEWTRRALPNTPGRRGQHQMVWDSSREKILLFGGSGQMPYNSEIWEYDGSDWSLLLATSPEGPKPGPGYGDAAFDSARGRLIIVNNPAGSWAGTETWEFDSAAGSWSAVYRDSGPAHSWPSARYGPLVYFPPQEHTIGYYGWLLDASSYTFEWKGAAWDLVDETTAHRQYFPVGAYDPVREQLVYYGCCRDIGHPVDYSETWGYRTNWVQLLPSFHTDGDALKPAVMAFDSRRRAMVMAGSNYAGSWGQTPMQVWEYRYFDIPHIDRSPSHLPLEPGADVQLGIHAAGAGTLSYQWFKDGLMLMDGPQPGGSSVAGARTDLLRISNLSQQDAAGYHCVVANSCGSQASPITRLGALTVPSGISVRLQEGTIVIEWAGSARLQSAPHITGPWTDVADQASPMLVVPSESQKFYRVVN
jgi:hypothetical protein